MNIDKILLQSSEYLLHACDKQTEEMFPEKIADIVKFHAKCAALSALGTAWVPGAGAFIANAAGIGFIWGMYARINNAIDLKTSENITKTLASGIVTNLGAYFIGNTLLSAAFSFIPGLGSVGASVLTGGMVYALTIVSGLIYLKILTNIFTAGKDPSTFSASQLKKFAESAKNEMDIEGIIDSAKNYFKDNYSDEAEKAARKK